MSVDLSYPELKGNKLVIPGISLYSPPPFPPISISMVGVSNIQLTCDTSLEQKAMDALETYNESIKLTQQESAAREEQRALRREERRKEAELQETRRTPGLQKEILQPTLSSLPVVDAYADRADVSMFDSLSPLKPSSTTAGRSDNMQILAQLMGSAADKVNAAAAVSHIDKMKASNAQTAQSIINQNSSVHNYGSSGNLFNSAASNYNPHVVHQVQGRPQTTSSGSRESLSSLVSQFQTTNLGNKLPHHQYASTDNRTPPAIPSTPMSSTNLHSV
jgi:hypothetical protein